MILKHHLRHRATKMLARNVAQLKRGLGGLDTLLARLIHYLSLGKYAYERPKTVDKTRHFHDHLKAAICDKMRSYLLNPSMSAPGHGPKWHVFKFHKIGIFCRAFL